MCLGSRAGPKGASGCSGLPRARASSTDRHCWHRRAGGGHTRGLPPSCPSRWCPPPLAHSQTPALPRDSQAHPRRVPHPREVSAWNHFKFWGGERGVLKGWEAAVGSQSCTPQPPGTSEGSEREQRRVGLGLRAGPGIRHHAARLLEFARALCSQPRPWGGAAGLGWGRAGGPVGWGCYLSTRPVGTVHTGRQCI